MSEFAERIAQLSPKRLALLALELQSKVESLEKSWHEPIAIIGIGCRFPGSADDPESFWRLLRHGVDAITEVPPDRWDLARYYDPDPDAPGKMNTRHGGFLTGVDRFDPHFFNISPREALSMDPQQRLLLEVAWEALEHAAQSPEKLEGSRTGVFVGICNADYLQRLLTRSRETFDTYLATGSSHAIASGRLSYFLGLHGPSLSIDTACSSSLVAIHVACQSLHANESRMALAGGVNLILSPDTTIMLTKARMMAADGRCKAFDASADGFVRGEGCGIVVLKRLADALADGDRVLAIIAGSAVNQDGRSSGITAPNGPAQETVIRDALAAARISPMEVGYVETHGTGTVLGDPIEVNALGAVYGTGRGPDASLKIGSVKTNIGHLESAAGVAGLIKLVLLLQQKQIPPHLHLKKLNPYIPWSELPIEIPTEFTPWPSHNERRIGAVSSFGFSGTNAHVVVSEAPAARTCKAGGERPYHLLTLSAKSDEALRAQAGRYGKFLSAHSTDSLADVCFTANTGRAHFSHRVGFVIESISGLQEDLRAFTAGAAASILSGERERTKEPEVVFLFTGQGTQYAGMGRQLYETEPLFRRIIDNCDEILRRRLDRSLVSVLYPKSGEAALLDETAYTQPALFALEYALAELWRSWGIQPAAVMGHSVGEYAAACVAGVFSLEDGLALVADRGRLMQALAKRGQMAVIFADEAQVGKALAKYDREVSIAAINGPKNVVISGAGPAVQAVIRTLEAKGNKNFPLNVSHAFHSPLMEPMLEEFSRAAAKARFSAPAIGIVSNVTGQLTTDASVARPDYWRRHAREAVRFSAGIQALARSGYRCFVEIGPSPTLCGMASKCLPQDSAIFLPSLRRGHDDWRQMLQTLAALYVHGVEMDFARVDGDYPRRKLALPTYPFQRERYWIDSAEEPTGTPEKIDNWLYELQWQPRIDSNQRQLARIYPAQPRVWLIFADKSGVGEALADQSCARGVECVLVFPKKAYERLGGGRFGIRPELPADMRRLLKDAFSADRRICCNVVHLWSLDAASPERTTFDSLETAQVLGCISVLHLIQELARIEQSESPRLLLVTRGAQHLAGETLPPALAQAPLWGLGRTIAQEHSELWGGLVDLDPTASPNQAAEFLWQEISHPDGEDQIAFRQQKRYVARLARKAPPPPALPFPIRSEGSYLITGGRGGLGLRVAHWLAEKGARHLILLGRTEMPPRSRWNDVEAETPLAGQINAIRELETSGVTVLLPSVDVANASQLQFFLDALRSDGGWPSIRGVVHAAGVMQYDALLELDAATMDATLRSKVLGGWLLHQLLQDVALDFFVMFSSASSLLNSPFIGSYAAANAFLDALAFYRKSEGRPALSVNWGPWAGAGMAVEFRTIAKMTAHRGMKTMAPSQALAVLERILPTDAAQVAVIAVNWQEWQQQSLSARAPLLSELLGQETNASDRTPSEPEREAVRLVGRLQNTPPGKYCHVLQDHVQSEVVRILGLNSTRGIGPQQPLSELGLDSLMAVELANALGKAIGRSLSATLAFKHPTIDALVRYLAKDVLGVDIDGEANRETLNDIDSRKSYNEALLDQMSEIEMAALLKKKLSAL